MHRFIGKLRHGVTRLAAPIVVPALASLLAACDLGTASSDASAPKVVITSEDGSRVITGSNGAVLTTPADNSAAAELTARLPDFAPAYPGAAVKARIEGVGPGRDEGSGGPGAMLVLLSADSVEKVAAFYDAAAKKAGVEPAMVVNEADSAVRIFGPRGRAGMPPAPGKGALIAITRSEDGPGTEIVITSGAPPGALEALEERDEPEKDPARPTIRLQ